MKRLTKTCSENAYEEDITLKESESEDYGMDDGEDADDLMFSSTKKTSPKKSRSKKRNGCEGEKPCRLVTKRFCLMIDE
jgi:hypothetical protein